MYKCNNTFLCSSFLKPTCQSSEKRREIGPSPIIDQSKPRAQNAERHERNRENKENLAVPSADGGLFALPAPITPASNRKGRPNKTTSSTPVNSNVTHKPVETQKGECVFTVPGFVHTLTHFYFNGFFIFLFSQTHNLQKKHITKKHNKKQSVHYIGTSVSPDGLVINIRCEIYQLSREPRSPRGVTPPPHPRTLTGR